MPLCSPSIDAAGTASPERLFGTDIAIEPLVRLMSDARPLIGRRGKRFLQILATTKRTRCPQATNASPPMAASA